MAAFWTKLYFNAVMALIICPALRFYWFVRPQRRHPNEKLVRFVDVVSLMAITLLLGNWLGGFAFYTGVVILTLMYWSEKKRVPVR